MNNCPICRDAKLKSKVELAIVAQKSPNAVAKEFGISSMMVGIHAREHLRSVALSPEGYDVPRSMGRYEMVMNELMGIAGDPDASPAIKVAALREYRQVLDSMATIALKFKAENAEPAWWKGMKERLILVCENFPDAREAILKALTQDNE